MATPGQFFENKNTGDTYEFLHTAASTNGTQVAIKFKLATKGPVVPKHFHVLQDETFEIYSGKLTIWLDGKKHQLCAGDKITLPKNVPHNHYNSEDEPVIFIQSVAPALDFELLVENIIGLTQDGKMPNGKAGILQELVTLRYLDSKSFLADMPVGLQKLMMHTIAPVARLMGYRAAYKKYCGIEK